MTKETFQHQKTLILIQVHIETINRAALPTMFVAVLLSHPYELELMFYSTDNLLPWNPYPIING
jgi:hypothetical protein